MTHELELFQREYLKKFSEEKEADSYESAVQDVINLSKSDNLSEFLTSIDKLRNIVFDKMWKEDE
jgi:hypothetical protein